MRFLFAAVLAVLPISAFADEIAAARETADWLRSVDGDVYVSREASGGGELLAVSRADVLAGLYSELAGASYKEGLDAKEPSLRSEARQGYERSKAASAEALKDAKAASIDPSLLTKSCRNSCTVFWGCVRICGGAGAVRGGRKLDTSVDKTLAALEVELQETGRGIMARSPGAMRATPYIRSGRVYEKMAQAVKNPGSVAPAAAAPAGPELTPRQVYAKASPAVVVVMAAGLDGNGELGTGSLIDKRGRVLTNAHVVIRDDTGKPFERVRFYLKPLRVTGDPKRDLQKPHAARVVRYDRALDLALLEAEEPMDEPFALSLGDSEAVMAGDPVVAIGHPEQGGLWTLTTGVVSTVVADLGGVEGKDAFQTDASINRGNSGGPLIDRRGRVIGVNTSMARKAADGLTITSVNFAVRAAVARRWLGKDAGPLAPAAEEPIADNVSPNLGKDDSLPAVAQPEPAPAPVEEKPAVVEEKPAPARKAPAPKAEILTEPKPYKIEETVEQAMKEMEDLEEEMRGEIQKRRTAPTP